MLLRSRLKKEQVNLRILKNKIICIFSLVLFIGLPIVSKQKIEMPEDKKLSSGYSVIRGNMVKIDNNESVKNYIKDRTYSFLESVEVLKEEDEYPQGLCFTEEYIFISSYSEVRGRLGKLNVHNKQTGERLITLGMDALSHLGGIAFDGKYIWVCNSSRMALERIPYSLILHMIQENKGEFVDARNLMEIYPVRNIPSTVSFYHGQLWVATHSIWTNSTMIGYLYNEEKEELRAIGNFKIPQKVQGIAFTEKGEIILSTSYGRKKNSYIKKYSSINDMSNNVKGYIDRIELPPCSEGIVYENGKLYVLFESAGKKYLEGTDGKGRSVAPLDRILKIEI